MYSTFDTPNEFFNLAPVPASPATPTAYTITSAALVIGCSDHDTPGTRFLTNLTAAQAASSTAQVVFALTDALYQRFNAIKLADAANAPTKFNITRSGYTDETTGELVYNYSITCRVTPGSLVAVNS